MEWIISSQSPGQHRTY